MKKFFAKFLLFLVVLFGLWIGVTYLLSFVVPSESESRASRILVEKNLRRLTVFDENNHILGIYKISLGAQPRGQKLEEGDGKTPEGNYEISAKNANTPYYLSLSISYPTRKQIMEARRRQQNPGGNIEIHGYPNWLPQVAGHFILKNRDWTNGSIALDNDAMDLIWSTVSVGTPIEIRP